MMLITGPNAAGKSVYMKQVTTAVHLYMQCLAAQPKT